MAKTFGEHRPTDDLDVVARRLLFSQTVEKTISNTTSETSLFGTGAGSLQIAANSVDAGDVLLISIRGWYSTPAVLDSQLTARVKIGGMTVGTLTTSSLLTGATNMAFDAPLSIVFSAVGQSGSTICHCEVGYEILNSNWVFDQLNDGGTPVTVDTTTNNNLDVTVQWNAASTTRSIRNRTAFVEILKVGT